MTRIASQHLIEESARFRKPMPALFDRRAQYEYVGILLGARQQRFGVTQSPGIAIDAPGRQQCLRALDAR